MTTDTQTQHLWRKVVRVSFVCRCGRTFKHQIEAVNHCAKASR